MNRVWITALVLIVGALVFRRVGKDYARYGKLTKASTVLQVLVFVLHGASSFILLDSRVSAIETANPLFGFATVLIGGGLVLLLTTMGRFGVKRAMGQQAGTLICAGMYRKSRNPQMLFYGISVVGYALLWPSWTGAIWVVLYVILASMMVRVEEEHLKTTYGKDYVDYCTRTPRFIDLPGRK